MECIIKLFSLGATRTSRLLFALLCISLFSSPLWAVSDLPVINQQAYIKASNTEEGDLFGFSLAISGNTLVVGAPYEDSFATGVDGDQGNNSSTAAGAVYVYTRNGTVWSQQAYLKGSNTVGGHAFGWSVAISGDTLVVGAYNEGGPGSIESRSSGAVYVFTRDGTVWSQQAYLKASNIGAGDRFGGSVAISGDTIVVGASEEESIATGINGDQSDNSQQHTGAAYVFARNGTEWSQQAYLKASNTHGGEQFGASVTISGNTIVVGAIGEDSAATGVNGDQYKRFANGSGAAYVFIRNDNVWTQQAYLKASNASSHDFFGYAVALSGNTLVVGAVGEDGEGANDTGAAYVFKRNDITWEQQAYLKASNADWGDKFGWSVAIDDETVVVGAGNEDSNSSGVNGDQGNGDQDNPAGNSGAGYVFAFNGAEWKQHAYLKASNTDGDDGFGGSVAISNHTILVGSSLEDSNARGINGTQSDNSALNAGAVYVYAPEFQLNAGLNDAWYSPATNGQGFLITVFPDRTDMFLAWFTYDTERPPGDVTARLGEPGHRWLTAQGPYDGNSATLTIYVTKGGVFDSAQPVSETDLAGDGTMTIEFADCANGLVSYEITSLGISGEIPIERIAPDNIALCETLSEQ